MKERVAADAIHSEESGKSASTSSDLKLKGHMPALDGVRGLAILMVLCVHFLAPGTEPGLFGSVIGKLSAYGTMGVDLFFVLSGFLITGILVDARKKPYFFRNFYMRRALRIFPLYYGVLLIGLVLVPAFFNIPELNKSVENQAWLWGYCANIFVSIHGDWEVLPFFSHFWSLAIEEHFYLIWPLVVFFNDDQRLKRIALWVAGVALLIRLLMVIWHVNIIAIYSLTPARMDALTIGGLMAVIAREEGGVERLKTLARRVAVIGSVFIVTSFFFSLYVPEVKPFFHELRRSAFTGVLGALLVFALTGPAIIQRIFKSGFMRFCGKYSYGLYVYHFLYGYLLLHYNTVDAVTRWLGSEALAILVQAILASCLAMVISLLSYHLYEKHFLKLKQYF
jgi:peptidoglycan/LPS O-acetylase OafA/YrhL